MVAGGCNFPEGATADSAQKVYYDDIYILENPLQEDARWKKAGKIPRRAAYGVSINIPEGILCIGGRDETGALKECWLLKREAGKSQIIIEKWPDLPVHMDNMAGATGGGKVYVAGGHIDGKPGNRCFSLLLNDPRKWEELPSFPGKGRVQAVGTVQNTSEESRFLSWAVIALHRQKRKAMYTQTASVTVHGIKSGIRLQKFYPMEKLKHWL